MVLYAGLDICGRQWADLSAGVACDGPAILLDVKQDIERREGGVPVFVILTNFAKKACVWQTDDSFLGFEPLALHEKH